jgi:hypothetical protein
MKRNFFSGSLTLVLGIVVIGAVTAFSLAGCDTDGGGGGGGGGIPSGLVGAWYDDTDGDGVLSTFEGTTAMYEFFSDGKFKTGGVDNGFTFSIAGDQISITGSPLSSTFKVEGKKLTITGSGASGFVSGTYLKKDGGGSGDGGGGAGGGGGNTSIAGMSFRVINPSITTTYTFNADGTVYLHNQQVGGTSSGGTVGTYTVSGTKVSIAGIEGTLNSASNPTTLTIGGVVYNKVP